ncbi:MAG: bifunctional oligoribonuclease/PAP phosphatase NrnA [Bacillota bacterium]
MRHPEATLTRVIQASRRVLVPLHEAPDGDSVGSAVAAAWAVEQLGARAVVASTDPIPRKYRFIAEGEREIRDPDDIVGSFDLLLLVDCSALSRVGRAADLIDEDTEVFSVDHHRRAKGVADWIWSDPESAATSEILMRWFVHADLHPTPFVASCMYTGIATDTGFFAYANTSADTLRCAADLVEYGASPELVHSEVNERRTLGETRLLGRALQLMNVEMDGKLAYTILDDEQFRLAGAGPEDTEGIINHLRSLDGVEMAAVFTHRGSGPVKVSFRSRGRVDVGEFAARFGGGGHDRAAGCSLDGEIDEIVKRVLAGARDEVARPF